MIEASQNISELNTEATLPNGGASETFTTELNKAIADGLERATVSERAKNILSESDTSKSIKETAKQLHLKSTAYEVNNSKNLQNELTNHINEISPYSEEVNRNIATAEELNHYLDNGFKEYQLGEKKVLIEENIDLTKLDEDGFNNSTRLQDGKAPLDPSGEPYNLHHIGQNKYGPFALLQNSDHKSMYSELHDPTKTSEINRTDFRLEKKQIFKHLADHYNG